VSPAGRERERDRRGKRGRVSEEGERERTRRGERKQARKEKCIRNNSFLSPSLSLSPARG
jgi:hypothetical protein